MIYVICRAKTEIAKNEEIPKFNIENWEVIENVKCRKNASMETYNSIFSPIYQKLTGEYEHDRLWTFKQEEIKIN